MDTVIRVDSLGKKYILRHQKSAGYVALRDVIAESAKRWGKRISHPFRSAHIPDATREEFWALKDVSFQIRKGDRVGIIGRNGAGKSTLLKVISRITEPTEGRVALKGRVASLLEVGTGFHPELTGRENTFLNGAILGMTKAEIKNKFDAIVDFAEIEKFLDTPVKRYSSGMYVRLAFAVAAHLEPEILVVDEVLAVGDAEFQKKCLGKMQDVGKEGRTVLFVSHNMTAIASLCSRLILLKNGSVDFIGDVTEGIDRYLTDSTRTTKNKCDDIRNHGGALLFSKFTNVETLNSKDEATTEFKIADCIKVKLELVLTDNVSNIEIGIALHNLMGTRLSHFFGEWEGFSTRFKKGKHVVVCEIPHLNCLPGMYAISPWIKIKGGGVDDQVDFAAEFTIIGSDITGFNPDFERYPNLGVYQKSKWYEV